jgi:lipoprotein-anchoring transpeptidase ErfK/SrfK
MKFNRTIWLAVAAISPVIAAQGFAQNAPVQQNAPAQIVTPPAVVPPTVVPDKQPVPEASLNKPVPVPPVVQKKPVAKKSAATDSLKPGQFVWENRASKESETKIVVVLDIQRLYVFQNGSLVAFSTISSGKKGHATPAGIFTILQKNKDHKSNIYDDAPMPYMQRLTWDGIALHAGHNPGRPASHGCIRLPLSFAKNLFDVTKYGQQVIVMKDLDTPPPPPPAPPVIVKPVEPPIAPPVSPPVVPEPTPAPATGAR